MKKMRKILSLALAVIMMMAMSITAFAADKTTITVNNLSAEESTTVSIYKIATINQAESKWDWAPWVTSDMYTLENGKTEYTFDYDKMKAGVAAKDIVDTKTASNGVTTVTFDNVEAGAYLVLATGDKTAYQTMVAKTYKYNDDSVFEAAAATVTAKTSTTIVTKDTDDTFVKADQLVTFTITSTVPYIADDAVNTTFVIYDKPENLKDLKLTGATIGGTPVNVNLSDPTDGVYSVDLKDYLITENIGKEVVLTLTANVNGANGYKNTAWSNRITDEDDYSVVTGYTGSFTLTKVDANNTAKTLAGAKFKIAASNGGDALEFTGSNGVYTLVDKKVSTNATVADELEVAANGTLKVQGLAEGTYYITETVAPEGYSVNTNIDPVTIEPTYKETTRLSVQEATGHVNLTGDKYFVKDTQLTSLPFTGGMGTTIFTVLGVAIMAIAAALFFASKRKASK